MIDSLDKLVAGVRKEAATVGQFLLNERKAFSQADVEYKGQSDMVSYVDKSAESQLIEQLGKLLPEAKFETEEGMIESVKHGLRWIIDPLDGTTNFIHGLPVYSVSIALYDDKEPLLGVVHEANRNESFHAFRGGDAFCNSEKISVSDTADFNKQLIATGFPYNKFDGLDDYIEILKHCMQNSHGLRRLGSAAVDLCYVACGRFDNFFEFNLNSYDIAGGAFVVAQAGGKVTDFGGGNGYHDGSSIVAGGAGHAALLEVIKTYWKS